ATTAHSVIKDGVPQSGNMSSPPQNTLPPGRCVPKGGHAPAGAGVTPALSGPERPPMSAVSYVRRAGFFCDSESLCHSGANRRPALSPLEGNPDLFSVSFFYPSRLRHPERKPVESKSLP